MDKKHDILLSGSNDGEILEMVHVAAAIIRNQNGGILICQRGSGGSCAHLWEFPGGKREPGETFEACLVRECMGELQIAVAVDRLYEETEYAYPERTVHVSFFLAHILAGEPQLNIHDAIRWAKPETLPGYRFCPADIPMIGRLARL